MTTRHAALGDAPLLSPFPEGWYFVARRQEVRKAKLLERTWMGERIVVWYDDRGQVCVAQALCPHLGSDLSPSGGGRVCDGRLVCPFHGFEFDTTGQCVATPYAKPPRSARLNTFQTKEVVDLVFAWWGVGGRAPQWSLPADPPDQAGWSDLTVNTLRFPGHPQETTENSVDLGHLRYVHGYGSVKRAAKVIVDGPCLESDFDFQRTQKIAGIANFTTDVSARTRIYGLGYSYVRIREHSIGLDMRLWVLATPVDGEVIDLALVSQTKEIRKPKRWIAGLGFLPVRLRAPLMNRLMSTFQRHDVLQDLVIWGKKRYIPRPLLCRSDGEIMRFRRYCAQFYPDPEDSTTVHIQAGGAGRIDDD